jgi:hypothetical protein
MPLVCRSLSVILNLSLSLQRREEEAACMSSLRILLVRASGFLSLAADGNCDSRRTAEPCRHRRNPWLTKGCERENVNIGKGD